MSPVPPFVEFAGFEHIDRILEIQKECYPPHLWETIEVFLEIIKQKNSFIMCVEENDDCVIVGYLLCQHGEASEEINVMPPENFKDGEYCIRDLAVLPEYRKNAYGIQLLEEFFSVNCPNNTTLLVIDSAKEFWLKNFVLNEIKKVKDGTIYNIIL